MIIKKCLQKLNNLNKFCCNYNQSIVKNLEYSWVMNLQYSYFGSHGLKSLESSPHVRISEYIHKAQMVKAYSQGIVADN